MKKWIIALLAIGSCVATTILLYIVPSHGALTLGREQLSQPQTIQAADEVVLAIQSSPRVETPPIFDEARISPKTHGDFQLAKGEDTVVASPGDLITFHIRGTVAEDCHTYPIKQKSRYARRNSIKLAETGVAWIAGEITTSPQPALDKNESEAFSEDIYIFTDPVVYNIPVRISPDAADGKTIQNLHMSASVATLYKCDPPIQMSFDITLTVVRKN